MANDINALMAALGIPSGSVPPQDPQQQRLDTMFSQPYSPPPVKPEKVPVPNQILAAIADAMGQYAAVRSYRPSPPSVLQDLKERRRQDAAEETNRLRSDAAGKGEMKRGRAALEYSEQRRREESKAEAEENERKRQGELEKAFINRRNKRGEEKSPEKIIQERRRMIDEIERTIGRPISDDLKLAYLMGGKGDTDKGDDKKDYAGFTSASQLRDALGAAADDEMKGSEKETEVDTDVEDPYTGVMKKSKRVVFRPSLTLQEARRRALARFPGAEAIFPEYAKEFTEETEPISLDEIRRKLESRSGAAPQ